MNKFSLWILPDQKTLNVLSDEIKRLAEKYDFQPFEPHLSLVGVLRGEEKSVRSQTHELVSELIPFTLQSTDISFSTTFYQNVFVRLHPTASLTNAFLLASKKFETAKDHVYMPHISLVYGNQDMETREKIMKEVKLPKFEFEVKSLFLFDTHSEDYTQWKKIEEFRF